MNNSVKIEEKNSVLNASPDSEMRGMASQWQAGVIHEYEGRSILVVNRAQS